MVATDGESSPAVATAGALVLPKAAGVEIAGKSDFATDLSAGVSISDKITAELAVAPIAVATKAIKKA